MNRTAQCLPEQRSRSGVIKEHDVMNDNGLWEHTANVLQRAIPSIAGLPRKREH